MITVFDIETAPDEEEVRRLVKLPEFVAPPKEFDQNHEFVLEKIGQAKVKKTRDSRIEEAREEWPDFVESAPERHTAHCEGILAKALDKAQLDPRYSRICAFGITKKEESSIEDFIVSEERGLLTRAWRWFELRVIENHTLYFYSGNNDSSIDCMFDYKFLLHRSRVHGIKIPEWAKPNNGRLPFAFRDLAIDYLGTWKYGEYRGADQCALELGLIDGDHVKMKKELPVTGRTFYKEIDENWNLSEAGKEYLVNDLRLELAIAHALQL